MPPPRPSASDSAAAGAVSSRSTSEPASTGPVTTTSTGSHCGWPCWGSTSRSTSRPSWSPTSRPWRDASVGRVDATPRPASGPGDPVDDRLGDPKQRPGEDAAQEEQGADGAGEAQGVGGDHHGDGPDQAAADDDAVGEPADGGGLLGGRDAETHGDRDLGLILGGRDEIAQLGGELGTPAGGADRRDDVDEALSGLADGTAPLVRGGGRDQRDQREPLLVERLARRRGLLQGKVGDDRAAGAGRRPP